MSLTEEKVIGEVPVITKLAIGSEELRLFLTNSRLIVAHLGKSGVGALATSSLLGKLGLALEQLVRGSRRSKGGWMTLTPERILESDKDNFYVNHEDIVRIELDEMVGAMRMVILTKEDKFQFVARVGLESTIRLLRETLGSKVIVGGAAE